VTCQALPQLRVLIRVGVDKPLKIRVEKTEEAIKCSLITAVRRCCEQHQMPPRTFGQTLEQLIALVTTATDASA
jgi:hypothetical protein